MTDRWMIQVLCDFAGIEVPVEDLGLLESRMASLQESLDFLRTIDTTDVESVLTFDPRW